MLSALLVQLFGREPIDRLAAAGYATAESITAAGPERLAEEGGIPIALARRIIAVAAEEQGEPDPATDAGEANASGKPAGDEKPAEERHVRRPFRRPQSDLASRERGPRKQAGKAGTKVKQKPPPADESPIDANPFVDDVGLVAWMGFAANRGAGPGGGWSVSDAILQSPAPEPEPAEEIPPPRTEILPPPTAAAAQPGAPVVEGSFWAFGGWKPPTSEGAPKPGERPPAPRDDPPSTDRPAPAGGPMLPEGSTVSSATAPTGAAGTPRRRNRDGH